jgi:hypothetical protein
VGLTARVGVRRVQGVEHRLGGFCQVSAADLAVRGRRRRKGGRAAGFMGSSVIGNCGVESQTGPQFDLGLGGAVFFE